jgi:aldose sugar dehydrogenase
MYVVSLGQGKIFKILPTADLDMSSSAGNIPSLPLASPETPSPPVVDEPVEESTEDNDDEVTGEELDDDDESEDEDDDGN